MLSFIVIRSVKIYLYTKIIRKWSITFLISLEYSETISIISFEKDKFTAS